METYYINYHTGDGNKIITGTLDDAMSAADNGAAYTQTNITIEDDEVGHTVAIRPWWGVEYNPDETDETNVITFGSFGYYGEWVTV